MTIIEHRCESCGEPTGGVCVFQRGYYFCSTACAERKFPSSELGEVRDQRDRMFRRVSEALGFGDGAGMTVAELVEEIRRLRAFAVERGYGSVTIRFD